MHSQKKDLHTSKDADDKDEIETSYSEKDIKTQIFTERKINTPNATQKGAVYVHVRTQTNRKRVKITHLTFL